MPGTQLVLHCGAKEVSRTELATVEAPPPTKTWFPIRHSDVLDAVLETVDQTGFGVERSASPENQVAAMRPYGPSVGAYRATIGSTAKSSATVRSSVPMRPSLHRPSAAWMTRRSSPGRAGSAG